MYIYTASHWCRSDFAHGLCVLLSLLLKTSFHNMTSYVRLGQILIFVTDFYRQLNFFPCYRENHFEMFVVFIWIPLTPPHSHTWFVKNYTREQNCQLSVKIQKCVCGGVHLSSVITINIFHVFNMQFPAALMGKHKENKW